MRPRFHLFYHGRPAPSAPSVVRGALSLAGGAHPGGGPSGGRRQILAQKTKFCSYVVSGHSRRRNKNRLEIFQKLSKYKQVDSGGRFMNNIGGPVGGAFPGQDPASCGTTNFTLPLKTRCCGLHDGETAPGPDGGTLPIYWGNPRVAEDFNPPALSMRAIIRTWTRWWKRSSNWTRMKGATWSTCDSRACRRTKRRNGSTAAGCWTVLSRFSIRLNPRSPPRAAANACFHSDAGYWSEDTTDSNEERTGPGSFQ